jgi:hypothetical protein
MEVILIVIVIVLIFCKLLIRRDSYCKTNINCRNYKNGRCIFDNHRCLALDDIKCIYQLKYPKPPAPSKRR